MAEIPKPNVVYIYGDDLGRGMLSCYGQKLIRTPNIDRIAEDGIRFTRAYGCVFCAPARASLLLGRHDCHAGRWSFNTAGIYQMIHAGEMSYEDIRELINNTGIQAAEDDVFLPELFKRAGYVTGQVGKLEWGFATTPERMRRHGWDSHYGYYDHRMCHGFYPPYLFEDGHLVEISGNTRIDCGKNPTGDTPENRVLRRDRTGKAVYSQDLFDQKAVAFLRNNRDRPFFLYLPSQLPHGPIDVEQIDPTVKGHPELTEYEQEYATMVLRLDRSVGVVLDELDALGLTDNTIVIFSSDNGHAVYYRCAGRAGSANQTPTGEKLDNIHERFTSELCGDVFNGNDGMAGLKTTNWEGGPRIPYVVRWPGRITPGSVSHHMFANYDLFATFAELLGQPVPPEKDSISLLPTLLGEHQRQRKHEHIVYASFHHGGALVTDDGWKLRHVRVNDTFQLYYLPDDYREEHDLAGDRPDKVAELKANLTEACEGDLTNGHIVAHRVPYANDHVRDFVSREFSSTAAIRMAKAVRRPTSIPCNE